MKKIDLLLIFLALLGVGGYLAKDGRFEKFFFENNSPVEKNEKSPKISPLPKNNSAGRPSGPKSIRSSDVGSKKNSESPTGSDDYQQEENYGETGRTGLDLQPRIKREQPLLKMCYCGYDETADSDAEISVSEDLPCERECEKYMAMRRSAKSTFGEKNSAPTDSLGDPEAQRDERDVIHQSSGEADISSSPDNSHRSNGICACFGQARQTAEGNPAFEGAQCQQYCEDSFGSHAVPFDQLSRDNVAPPPGAETGLGAPGGPPPLEPLEPLYQGETEEQPGEFIPIDGLTDAADTQIQDEGFYDETDTGGSMVDPVDSGDGTTFEDHNSGDIFYSE